MTLHNLIPPIESTMEVLRLAVHNLHQTPQEDILNTVMRDKTTGEETSLVLVLALITAQLSTLTVLLCQQMEANAKPL